MKKLVLMITAIAVVAIAAQTGECKSKPAKGEKLLPSKVIENLALTADQKTKLDELTAAFKKDLEAWEQAHPNFKDEWQKARTAQDKEALKKLKKERKPVLESRKKYIEQFKETLTDEQKKKVEEMKEKMKATRGHKRGGKGPKGPPPPPPAGDTE
jgi:Spy/CpxP family protein refolding chaperone